MAYTKTLWKPRGAIGRNRFLKSQETPTEVYLDNEPLSITEPGTPFSAENMNKIEDGIEQAHAQLAAETQARTSGDADTLAAAKDYADGQIADTVAATQTWLPAVDTLALLPEITDISRNWLCRVRDAQTVYQCVAGQTEWTAYSDGNDFVNETELDSGINNHNADNAAHEDIRTLIGEKVQATAQSMAEALTAHNESATAHEDIRAAFADEARERILTDQDLLGRIEALVPEGMENLPGLFEGIEEQINKRPIDHAAADDTYGAGTDNEYGHVKLNSTTAPKMDGTAAVGASGKAADAAHVHPTDKTRAPLCTVSTTDLVDGDSSLPKGTFYLYFLRDAGKINNRLYVGNNSDKAVLVAALDSVIPFPNMGSRVSGFIYHGEGTVYTPLIGSLLSLKKDGSNIYAHIGDYPSNVNWPGSVIPGSWMIIEVAPGVTDNWNCSRKRFACVFERYN